MASKTFTVPDIFTAICLIALVGWIVMLVAGGLGFHVVGYALACGITFLLSYFTRRVINS